MLKIIISAQIGRDHNVLNHVFHKSYLTKLGGSSASLIFACLFSLQTRARTHTDAYTHAHIHTTPPPTFKPIF